MTRQVPRSQTAMLPRGRFGGGIVRWSRLATSQTTVIPISQISDGQRESTALTFHPFPVNRNGFLEVKVGVVAGGLVAMAAVGAAADRILVALTQAVNEFPWLQILLAICGAAITILLAVFGWILRQIHRELREVVLSSVELAILVSGKDGQGGLVRKVHELDDEKISEHRARSLIQGHVEKVIQERGGSRRRDL